MEVQMKRVYEKPNASDGNRILIDRLWPRGLTKEKAKVDVWLKDVAPSTELRRWFGHDPSKWNEFKKRYHGELKDNNVTVGELVKQVKKGKTTLVYGTKDEEHNDAVVIKEYLEKNIL
jgi:uncharacterized protein YeaO (DUF488 family)